MFFPKYGHLNTLFHGKQRWFCHWIGGLTEQRDSVCHRKITNYFPSLKSLRRKDCSNIRGLLFNVNGMLYSAGVLCTQKNPISFGLCQAADKSAVHLLFSITDLCRPDIFINGSTVRSRCEHCISTAAELFFSSTVRFFQPTQWHDD